MIPKCLVLHPVTYPNHGPRAELNYAEEAVGLAKTLGWDLVRGPFWSPPEDEEIETDPEKLEPPEHGRRGRIPGQISRKHLRDGEYVYTPGMQGIYWKGGLIMDRKAYDDEADLYDEWRN